MAEIKCNCPLCGGDISEFVKEEVFRYIRRRNAEKARKAVSPEVRKANAQAGLERMHKWMKEHPDEVRAKMTAASHARTPDSFKRQSQTRKATNLRKAVVLAELLAEAKAKGIELTPQYQAMLVKKAAEIVRAENKEVRRKTRRKKAE